MLGRVFNPAEYFSDQEHETMHVDKRCLQRLSDNPKTLLIDIQGAVRRANTNREMGAYGAYFGPQSSFNRCGLLPKEADINDQAAELHSAISALRTVEENSLAAEMGLVVLKVSSNYLPQHMNGVAYTWESQGYINSKKKPVVHAELFRELHGLFVALEMAGTAVQLWKVTREMNKSAEKLAKAAFSRR